MRNRPASKSETSIPNEDEPDDDEIAQRAWERIWQEALDPGQVADMVFKSMSEERFYILTHPEYTGTIELRMRDILEGRNPSNALTVLVS